MMPVGKRLVEPFCGSGVVFLNAGFKENLICDVNNDIITLYTYLAKEGMAYVKYCRKYFTDGNTLDAYLKAREKFNNTKDNAALRGALFLYLNRHCFNGLTRYNKKGEFNVPFGKYKNVIFPEEAIKHFILKTRRDKCVFVCQDFKATMSMLKKRDIVYCDPPYSDIKNKKTFTAYTGHQFTNDDHQELVNLALNCKRPVLISNHYTEYTKELYQDASFMKKTKVKRLISAALESREEACEVAVLFNAPKS